MSEQNGRKNTQEGEAPIFPVGQLVGMTVSMLMLSVISYGIGTADLPMSSGVQNAFLWIAGLAGLLLLLAIPILLMYILMAASVAVVDRITGWWV